LHIGSVQLVLGFKPSFFLIPDQMMHHQSAFFDYEDDDEADLCITDFQNQQASSCIPFPISGMQTFKL
jgi:hypothetical protein